MLLLLPVLATSCDSNDDPESPGWFGGKEFTATTYGTADYWILSFDKKSGAGYDGYFKVVPYTADGKVSHYATSYGGKYQVDYDVNRIYVTYDNGGTSYWTFADDYDDDEWPNYNPNRIISIPSNATGVLAGLTFYSGNVFKSPYDDDDEIED